MKDIPIEKSSHATQSHFTTLHIDNRTEIENANREAKKNIPSLFAFSTYPYIRCISIHIQERFFRLVIDSGVH